jgi:Starch-binding associating with outer membrane
MKKLLIILTVLLVLGSSCSNFLSVDEKNPNSASFVPANLILPAAINNTAKLLDSPGNFQFIYLWYGSWSISGGYSQDLNLTGYNLTNAHYQNNWYYGYTALQNYDYIIKNSATPDLRAYKAISIIMEAYHYEMLVDCYGNVPYSQALKSDQGILKPAYDDAQTIYRSLVVNLDTAMNLINTIPATAQQPGSYDIIYNGDMTMWWKFANTLKLRLLMNQSAMADAATYIPAALATTAHTTSDYIGVGEGAMSNPGYSQSAGKMNPFYERFYKQDGSQQADGLGYYAAGGDACDFMNANNDPRRLRIFAPYTGTSIAGNYYGTLSLLSVTNTSKLGSGLIGNYNSSAPILPDFESLFLQAEAVHKGYITGATDQALYESAVTQSIVYLGGAAADAVTYLAQAGLPNVNWGASGADPLKAIFTQKWLAMNGIDPIALWDDVRRNWNSATNPGTTYPDFIHWSADPAKLNATPCVRLLYPQTEINTNNDNVLAQGNINLFTSKIFWMPATK